MRGISLKYNIIYLLFTYTLLFTVSLSATETTDPDVLAAEALLERVLPGYGEYFIFKKISKEADKNVFIIESRDNSIIISGDNGVSMASGLNWYLKYYCDSDISLFGTQINVAIPLPEVSKPIKQVNSQKYRYMLNYCSFGYTMAWWDWNQWEKLIDWMALNGINLPLAVTGQEAVWQNVAKRIGIDDLSDFFTGPPYLPFSWMGNLDGWGGPLSENWIQEHEELQKR
ncbi:MAG: alpha-N-acetylglucosaminidase TIM-barrel domain-containing protein, partial [Bacteroidota bacterium]